MTVREIVEKDQPLRTFLRRFAGASGGCRIELVEGSEERPVVKGEGPYYTTENGTLIRHVSAYREKCFRVVYHRSTSRVEVGELWLTKSLLPKEAENRILRKRLL